jgi:hypothetical protein
LSAEAGARNVPELRRAYQAARPWKLSSPPSRGRRRTRLAKSVSGVPALSRLFFDGLPHFSYVVFPGVREQIVH